MASSNIAGLDDLEKAFKRLDKNTQGQVLHNAVRSGSLPIQNSAVDRCPVRFGNLKRSIHTEVTGTSNYAQADIGTDVEYAPYVELGTSKQAAQPYLRPAYDENKDASVKEIGEALKAQLV